VRHRADEQPVIVERNVELDRFEEFARTRGREDRQPVRGSVKLSGQVLGNPFDVALEAGALR
jgi:hypothetical protein